MSIWVFNGEKSAIPSAVFNQRQEAEVWIKSHELTGMLTKYPVGIPIFDWAIANNYFAPKNDLQQNARAIANFSSAYLEHYHYENGE